MLKHSLINRTITPVVGIAVISCVWYAVQGRPEPATITASGKPANVPALKVTADQRIAPDVSPQIKKLGSTFEFSLTTLPMHDVQRVEFFVESQFVGTAYSRPYSVDISENNLIAGSHSVTAKIYTSAAVAQTLPTTFTAAPLAVPAPSVDGGDKVVSAKLSPAPTTAGPIVHTPAVPAPTNLSASVGTDAASVTLSWTASSGASNYKVFQNGNLVATTTGTGYTDTGLVAGYTYDYQIVALDSLGNSSDFSSIVSVTIPASPPDPSAAAVAPQSQNLAPNPQSPATN